MATPLVAGGVAVLREFLRTKKGIAAPTAALLKASLIAGAQRLAGTAPANTLLDIHQGFGRVNLDRSVRRGPSRPSKGRVEDRGEIDRRNQSAGGAEEVADRDVLFGFSGHDIGQRSERHCDRPGGKEARGPRWTAENRPLIDTSKPAISGGRPRPVEFYFVGLLGAQVGLDFGAPAPRSAFEDVRVMEQPIEQRGDGGGVAEQLAPVVDGSV